MKRRILSLFLVFILLCTMSVSAAAASASEDGEAVGSGGRAATKATLDVYTEHATAVTWCAVSTAQYSTTVSLYFTDGNVRTRSGYDSVTYYKESGIDVPNTSYGTSTHYVNAGARFGSWGTSLRANVW